MAQLATYDKFRESMDPYNLSGVRLTLCDGTKTFFVHGGRRDGATISYVGTMDDGRSRVLLLNPTGMSTWGHDWETVVSRLPATLELLPYYGRVCVEHVDAIVTCDVRVLTRARVAGWPNKNRVRALRDVVSALRRLHTGAGERYVHGTTWTAQYVQDNDGRVYFTGLPSIRTEEEAVATRVAVKRETVFRMQSDVIGVLCVAMGWFGGTGRLDATYEVIVDYLEAVKGVVPADAPVRGIFAAHGVPALGPVFGVVLDGGLSGVPDYDKLLGLIDVM